MHAIHYEVKLLLPNRILHDACPKNSTTKISKKIITFLHTLASKLFSQMIMKQIETSQFSTEMPEIKLWCLLHHQCNCILNHYCRENSRHVFLIYFFLNITLNIQTVKITCGQAIPSGS